jgi:hypothetical protein
MLLLNNLNKFTEYLTGSEADPELLYKTSSPQLGLYQFTPARLKEIAIKNNLSIPDPNEFLNNPNEQDQFYQLHIQMVLQDIENNNLNSFIGSEIEGANKYPYKTNIQLWGLVAGEHLGGLTGLKNFLIDGTDPHDNNGTYISDYIAKFSDFYLNQSSLNIASIGLPGILGIILLIGLILAYK